MCQAREGEVYFGGFSAGHRLIFPETLREVTTNAGKGAQDYWKGQKTRARVSLAGGICSSIVR